MILQKIPCIRYPIQFQEGWLKVIALIESASEVNAMTPNNAIKLGFTTQKTSVRSQRINSLPLELYVMVSASFLRQNSLGKIWFFEETFLLANTSMEVILEIPFLSFSNIDIEFAELRKLT